MLETFTPRRFYFRLGLVLTIAFSGMLIAGVEEMSRTALPERLLFGILFVGSMSLSFVGLALWFIAYYYREAVAIDEEDIHLSGVLRQRVIPFASVSQARWDGNLQSLKLSTPVGRWTISLSCYGPQRCRRLIELLRDKLNADVQTGWDESMKRWLATEDAAMSVAEYNRRIRRGFGLLLASGPLLGVICGLIVYLCGGHAEGQTGVFFLTWARHGLGASLLWTMFSWVVKWVSQPEELDSPFRNLILCTDSRTEQRER